MPVLRWEGPEHLRSRGGRHTSSPDEDVAKSRNGSRLSHPFQEEMMRMTQGWTGLRTAVIALGLIAWTTTGAKADAISNCSITARPDRSTTSIGVTGANVISYVPVTETPSRSTRPRTFPWVRSRSPPCRPARSTTYNNTPFSITFCPSSLQRHPLDRHQSGHGHRHAQRHGHRQLSVERERHVQPGHRRRSFELAGASSTLNMLPNDQKLLVPVVGRRHDHPGRRRSRPPDRHPQAPVPEPSTIALFLSTVGGLGLRKYVLARRQRSQA